MQHVPSHPNMLHFIGVCEQFKFTDETGNTITRPFSFVTEYMRGGSIEDFFGRAENKGLSSRLLLPWAIDIARGIAHLHANKLVHRDLAARNVLIDKDRRAVLADFGLLRPIGDARGKSYYRVTSGGMLPVEIAPEAMRQEQFSAASDIYRCQTFVRSIQIRCCAVSA